MSAYIKMLWTGSDDYLIIDKITDNNEIFFRFSNDMNKKYSEVFNKIWDENGNELIKTTIFSLNTAMIEDIPIEGKKEEVENG